MYAPVVLRFQSLRRDWSQPRTSQAYVQQWLQDAQMREWIADAAKESALKPGLQRSQRATTIPYGNAHRTTAESPLAHESQDAHALGIRSRYR